ncbi:nuclease-related domain-containing protein [Streptomyces sp. NPDC006784]|uniref:nuclease-related domain-containing protein n=1 Tax=Streptomyces sp. NPDC006784 TaxID=3364764 RepID=UPI0036A866A3
MTTGLFILAAAVALLWLHPRDRHRPGPGASATARARQLRTPLVRLASLLGISTRRGRAAARFEAGAVGERATARLLAPLVGEGWSLLHDRALPGSRANVDHLVISPTGVVLVPDSKRWSARYELAVWEGRLWHGGRDVTDRLNGLRHETAAVARLLGVPVVPLVVMHGAPLPEAGLLVAGIRIVPANRAVSVLRRIGAAPGRQNAALLRRRAARLLPPYQERPGHG